MRKKKKKKKRYTMVNKTQNIILRKMKVHGGLYPNSLGKLCERKKKKKCPVI